MWEEYQQILVERGMVHGPEESSDSDKGLLDEELLDDDDDNRL
jgi:hypothetical protein